MNSPKSLFGRALNRLWFQLHLTLHAGVRIWVMSRLGLRLALIAGGLPLRKEYLVMHTPGYRTGMFSHMTSLIGLLEHYEAWGKCYAGLEVDFGEAGLYYDPTIGPNWWAYFMEPLNLGSRSGAATSVVSDTLQIIFATRVEQAIPRGKAADIVRRYIRPQPAVLAEADAFIAANLHGNYSIGIHYRGTDKREEALLVRYEAVQEEIVNLICKRGPGKYSLFVATDEQAFIDFMRAAFPGRVSYRDSVRSTDQEPIHLSTGNNYKKGYDAILDCLILSRCDHLVRTTSNLGMFASFLHPSMPVSLLTANFSTKRPD